MKKTILLALIGLILVSCQMSEPLIPLLPVTNIQVEERGESLYLTWDKVENATDYYIYFTSNGDEPNLDSDMISIKTNSYLHESLDPTLTYKYKIVAEAENYESSKSEITQGNLPMPILTITGNFSSYMNKKIGVMQLEVNYNPETNLIENSPTKKTVFIATPDNSGNIIIKLPFNRTKYLGYAFFIDLDESGTISSGDIIPGNGSAGYYTYSYYKDFSNKSIQGKVNESNFSSSHIF